VAQAFKGRPSDTNPTWAARSRIFIRSRFSICLDIAVLKYFTLPWKSPIWLARRWNVSVFNVCTSTDDQFRAFERLLNRINRTMGSRQTYAHLICDQGKELQYTTLVRKMRVLNYIPSKFGGWETGQPSKNIPIERIIEDPQFKDSKSSYLIQQADFIA
jgi:hypothetical protein